MEARVLFDKLNLFKECRDYNLSIWQCPSFVFLILGIVNIVAMIGTYLIANRFTDQPEFVALIVIGISLFIFIISHSVTEGFDKLAQANKMKTEFVSIASHQLRTPLSGMRWSLNLLKEGRCNPADTVTFIDLIKENTDRMIRLVNDLLDVSRIEMGKNNFIPRQTNLHVLFQKIINDSQLFAKANNISLQLEAPATLSNVFTDPDKISLVIQNLIDNAIKYTKGAGEVKVSLREEKKFVKVTIQDTGVGIPKSQQKHIFQKFFRSDNIMKHQTIGTGLGLFIAKAIIEQSHGQIWFESEEGKGTTFYFTLPIYK
ncbi:cell wall metabolism sensor histidine kinase WalK [Patescibacteria group bacterium]|nr:cell wall metabolism sensor histidine kinase WalK [Patescibacteria group bacterium]MBU4143073.1 cell wall metabolism sensor histidine kinase WalK [Patescibacteria group bacterium]